MRSADGSALMSMGGTRVICTASLVSGAPAWREASGGGWLTAEYGMLPASTGSRRPRDVSRGRPDGRTVEIQRLVGRSLRAVVDIDAMGPRTLYIDCDVLEADGGTRCAAITGAFVAVRLAFDRLVARGDLERVPLTDSIAAVSCGLVGGAATLDLDYPEDSTAEVDMNVVMTGSGELVEVQATAEGVPFSRASLDELLGLAAKGIAELQDAQEAAGRGRRLTMRSALRIVMASRNRHKVRELAGLLAPHTLEPLPDSVQLPPEDGETFADNALIKARAAAAATGAPALADDSGIVVAALADAPGVRSARYAGEAAGDEENLRKLLETWRANGIAGPRTSACSRSWSRTGRSACSRAVARGGWPTCRGERAGSATTPRSCPTI